MKAVKSWMLVAGLGAAGAVMVTAGPLNPQAGPVGSTYKTLSEVEPRVPVQSLSGDSTAQYVISQQGSYYLAANMTGVSGKNGIRVLASNVTLDLRGFVMDGAAAGGDAVHAEGSLTNLVVRDGTIRSWTGAAVSAATVAGADCRGLLMRNCASGLNLGQGAVADLCIGADMAGNAIGTGQDSRATRCTAMRTGGINVAQYGLARRCVVGAAGALSATTALECTVRGGGGIQVSYVAEDCTSTLSNGYGIVTVGLVGGCTASHNAGDGILNYAISRTSDCATTSNTGHGIRATGDSVVRECASIGNSGAGVYAINVQNVLEHNMLSANSAAAISAPNGYYGAYLANFLGPGGFIQNPSQQAGYIGQLTTPPANFVSTDPWMNVAY